MKFFYALLTVLVLFSGSAMAQKSKKESKKENKKDEISGDYYLIKGTVFDIDIAGGPEHNASNAQVVVYQGEELYVAFFTNELGEYEFYLPIGSSYTVWYGGSAFVNKKVSIDATQFPKERKPRTVPLDMGLFRPIDNFEFTTLKEPYVKIAYDPEQDQIAPDMEYTEKKKAELEKVFKKAVKVRAKNKKKTK